MMDEGVSVFSFARTRGAFVGGGEGIEGERNCDRIPQSRSVEVFGL